MKFLSALALSLLAHSAVLPARKANDAHHNELEQGDDDVQDGFDEEINDTVLTKPVAIATAETLKTIINVVLVHASTLSAAQTTAENLGTFVNRQKP
ncbi:hypothetical protein DSO57_1032657 [Entomophthora muscae]|uniref:Uncharacterized protein n=1 Tax=Entomophthora muscae TaxID=34485 RepID=A0ACC2REY7_9FUNG|nr:hypothetical protein DSO57_1032657 [Entomophthora muscae]